MDKKTCTGCSVEKALEEFTKRSKSPNGRGPLCVPCKKAKDREAYLKDRESRLEKAKDAYHKDPEAAKAKARAWEQKAKEEDPEGFRKKKTDAQRARREAAPEEVKAYNREKMRKYRKNPDKNLVALQRLYGLSVEQFRAMEAAQGNRCKMCKRTPEEAGDTRLCVDHCHATGKVRGLLCSPCNKLLGNAQDKIEILQAGIDYLKESLTSAPDSDISTP